MVVRNMQSRQIRLFQNDQLEKLTRISMPVFAVMWSVVLTVAVWLGWGTTDPLTAAGLFSGALLFWLFFEYAVHRYLFHWKPRSKLLERWVFVIHGNHHAYPNDSLRNLMPPIVSLPIASAIWGGFVLLIGPAGTWAFLGFILGYIAYDLLHYACHQWPMKGMISTRLKRHHMRHHHIAEDRNFAITIPLLDQLFGSEAESAKPTREAH